jgi:uncharacterized protein YtpQ (UPF0354 family)
MRYWDFLCDKFKVQENYQMQTKMSQCGISFFYEFEKKVLSLSQFKKKRKINLEISKIMINTHKHTQNYIYKCLL